MTVVGDTSDGVPILKIGFIEPHLMRFGGIRRMIEFANRLIARGHEVTFYVPDGVPRRSGWMQNHAPVRRIEMGLDDVLDVIVVNEETQWYVAQRFRNAGRRITYALHAAWWYGKAGTWEFVRAPVDYQLANSTWTAEQVLGETGHCPQVMLGGVNRKHFYPVGVKKRYPVLCVGDRRTWKGTEVIRTAASQLGLPLREYAGFNLGQEQMAKEYASAEVFVVGSDFEGFGQPGLEALACGTPLVTTDNGGCREYAVHEETALVVPPRDPEAMAGAIRRLRADPELAAKLRGNGLELVAERFDWEKATTAFEDVICRVAAGHLPRPRGLRPNQRGRISDPELSVVVLQWDQRHHTQRCTESLRRNTDVAYELIIVDNGSTEDAASYVEQAADVPVMNGCNLGFAGGMNRGLEMARGEYVAFVNNDTWFPKGWASTLLTSLRAYRPASLIVPAVTAAGNDRTVRTAPRNNVEVLAPFEAPPSAVVYVAERKLMEAVGGWGEEFPIASAEDVDLCFKLWVNGIDILFDERVLVEHVGKGTSAPKLGDYERQWSENRSVLFRKWTSSEPHVPRLPSCPEDEFARNLAIARSVAGWMQRYFIIRERLPRTWVLRRTLRVLRPATLIAVRLFRLQRDRWFVQVVTTFLGRFPRLRRAIRKITA